MRIALRGDVVLSREGVGDVEVRGRRTRLALAFLVLERRRRIPRHELADVIWPEGPPPSWPSSLREVVSHVRAAFAAIGHLDVVQTRDRCLVVVLPDDAVVDVEAALAPGGPGADPRRDGPFGADLLPDCDGPWVGTWRARLRAAHLLALRSQAEDALGMGDHEGALICSSRLIEEDRLDESSHRVHILALVTAGRRGQALDAFETCRRLLAEELGLDLSEGLQALHQKILQGSPVDRRGAVAAQEGPQPSDGRLAELRRTSPLVGRDDQLSLVREALFDADALGGVVIVLRGEPAIGKTRLMAEIAATPGLRRRHILYARCDPGPPVAMSLIEDLLGSAVDDAVRPGSSGHLARHLTQLAAGTRVLVQLDDLQWIDDASARTLARLLHVRAPIDLVLAHRGGRAPDALATLLDEVHIAAHPLELELGPLPPQEVGRLMAATEPLGISLSVDLDAPSSVGTVAWLHEQSGGNPGVALEMASALGLDQEATGIPEAVVRWVDAHLRRISSAALRVLQGAAVLGAEHRLEALALVVGEPRGDSWLDALDELIDVGLLVPDGHDGDQLAFRHHVVRRRVLGCMSPARRRHLTGLMADADVILGTPYVPPAAGQRLTNDRPAPAA